MRATLKLPELAHDDDANEEEESAHPSCAPGTHNENSASEAVCGLIALVKDILLFGTTGFSAGQLGTEASEEPSSRPPARPSLSGSRAGGMAFELLNCLCPPGVDVVGY